jgi:hypothetical protein
MNPQESSCERSKYFNIHELINYEFTGVFSLPNDILLTQINAYNENLFNQPTCRMDYFTENLFRCLEKFLLAKLRHFHWESYAAF